MSAPQALEGVRAEIERVDREIIRLIEERVRLARSAGPLKRAVGAPLLDPPREAEIVRRAGTLARERGLDGEAVRAVFWQLVGLCRRAQEEAV